MRPSGEPSSRKERGFLDSLIMAFIHFENLARPLSGCEIGRWRKEEQLTG
jgi:hypothetical protein